MIESDPGPLRISCWIRWMRFAILPATILTTSASVMADAICITSPNHPQTFTYGAMIWHELYLQCTAHELAARITSVTCLMPATTNREGMNHLTFAFPVSNSI